MKPELWSQYQYLGQEVYQKSLLAINLKSAQTNQTNNPLFMAVWIDF